jgi:excisionase family DNA binding protein
MKRPEDELPETTANTVGHSSFVERMGIHAQFRENSRCLYTDILAVCYTLVQNSVTFAVFHRVLIVAQRDTRTLEAGQMLLTAREAAQYLRVSLFTLSKIEKQGLLTPFRTPGGHRRYSVTMLQQYLEKSRYFRQSAGEHGSLSQN